MILLNKLGLQCRYILFAILLNKYVTLAMAATSPVTEHSAKDVGQFSARGIGRSLAQCLSVHEMSNCLKEELLHFLDVAARDNSSWRYNDFLSFERKSTQENQNDMNFEKNREKRSFSDTLAEKLLLVGQTRSLQLTLPKEYGGLTGISNAVDDIFINASSKPTILTSFTEEGTVRVFNGLVEDKIEAISYSGHKKKKKKKKKKVKEIKDKNKKKKKNKIWYLNNKNPLKGRKKKDKDKNMAMMGGMAMMAMVAQMFLGKVILIAGAAFVMAKIALLVSVLGSLKKNTGGSSGSTTEHVIISGGGGGGGHSHDSGWHRSMPYDHVKLEPISEEHSSVSSPHIETDEYSNAGPPSLSINSKDFQSSYYTLKENDDQKMPIFL